MIELIKLQDAKQSADKLCMPNRYQPPPKRELIHGKIDYFTQKRISIKLSSHTDL